MKFQQNPLGENMICNQFIKMYDNLHHTFVSYVLKVLDLLADFRWFSYCDCILCTTVDVRNHAPVPVSLPHYLQGFIHPRWLAGQTPAEFTHHLYYRYQPFKYLVTQGLLRSPHSTPHLTPMFFEAFISLEIQ